MTFRGFGPGERLTKRNLNQKLQEAGKGRVHGRRVRERQGQTVLADEEVIFLKITEVSTTGPKRYGWKEVFHNKDTGVWTDFNRTGSIDSDPAFEIAGSTLATGNTVYQAERSRASGAWMIRSGGGGGGANTVTNPIIMILGTYDEYKNCPDAPPAPPLNASNQPCWPAYAWAAYEVCGYEYVKKFDARDYGAWAYGLNGGNAPANRRFYSAFYGDSATSCQGVRFLEYCSQGSLSCNQCPEFITDLNCLKITFTTPARPCAYDPGDPSCGYNCVSAFSGMDSANAWDQTFTTTLCKGLNCSFSGTVGPFTINLLYTEIPRGYPTCFWGPATVDPCDVCYGFGKWALCIDGPGDSSSTCGGCLLTGWYSNSQIKSIKENCTTQGPDEIVPCNACSNGTESFKLIIENSVTMTCCSQAESDACP